MDVRDVSITQALHYIETKLIPALFVDEVAQRIALVRRGRNRSPSPSPVGESTLSCSSVTAPMTINSLVLISCTKGSLSACPNVGAPPNPEPNNPGGGATPGGGAPPAAAGTSEPRGPPGFGLAIRYPLSALAARRRPRSRRYSPPTYCAIARSPPWARGYHNHRSHQYPLWALATAMSTHARMHDSTEKAQMHFAGIRPHGGCGAARRGSRQAMAQPLRVLVCSEIVGLREAASAAVKKRLGASVAVDWLERSPASLAHGGDARQQLLDAEVILADPGAVVDVIDDAASLRWMQSSWAGVNVIFDRTTKRDYTCTRLAGVFGPLMAEYVLGYILLHERRLLLAAEQQRTKLWDDKPF
eukprot:COSAG05_NODE_217_length_13794_cov_5.734064_14_plen_357_part_01